VFDKCRLAVAAGKVFRSLTLIHAEHCCFLTNSIRALNAHSRGAWYKDTSADRIMMSGKRGQSWSCSGAWRGVCVPRTRLNSLVSLHTHSPQQRESHSQTHINLTHSC